MKKQCEKCANGCLLDQTKQLVESFQEQARQSEKSEGEKGDLELQINVLKVVIESQEASHKNLVAKNQNDANQKKPETLSNVLQKTVASSETNDELKKSINEKKAVKNSHEQQSKDQIKQVAGTEKNPLKVSQTEEVKVDKQMNFVSIMDTLPEQTKQIMKSVLESIKFDVSWTSEVEEKVLQKIKRIDEQFDLYGPFRKLIPRHEKKRQNVKPSGIQQIYVKQNINIPLFSYWLETLGINLNMLDISHDQDEDKMLTVELYDNNRQHHSSITGLESLFDKKEMNKFIAILNKNYCKRAKAYPKKNEPVTVKTFEIKDNFFVGLVSEAAQFKNIKPTQIVFTVDYLCSLKPGELKQYLKPKPVEQPKNAPDAKQQKNTQTQPNNVVFNPQSYVQDQYQTRSAAAEGIHTQNFKSTNEIQKPIRVQTDENAISTIFGIPSISSQQIQVIEQKFSLSKIAYDVSELALEVGKVKRATINTILTFLKIELNSVQFQVQAEPVFKTNSAPFQIVKNYRKPYLPKVYCKFLLQPQVWILDLEKFDWRLQDAIETIRMAGLLVNCIARVERLKWFEFICIKGDGLTPYYIEDVLRSLRIGQNQRRFEGANNQRYTVRVTKTVLQVIPTKVDQSFDDYYDDEDDEEAQRWGQWARIKGAR